MESQIELGSEEIMQIGSTKPHCVCICPTAGRVSRSTRTYDSRG